METKECDITIIGSGLTGLSLGYFLQRKGYSVCLIDKAQQTGGVIDTVTEKGFTFETGPNTGTLSSPEIVELFEDLGDKCSLVTANKKAKRRLIMKNGRWLPLPSGPLSAITTPLFNPVDKFRILGEPFRKKGTDPFESVADMVRRRLGRSYLDYAVDPFISGIYAGDPDQLVTRYALPKLYRLEQDYGSFILGAIRKRSACREERMKKATREVFSARGGLKTLIRALESEFETGSIRLGCERTGVNSGNDAYETNCFMNGKPAGFRSARLITTCGAQDLQKLLTFIDDRQLKPITDLKYAPVIQVVTGFSKWTGMSLDAFGGLVPSGENRNVLGILFPSSIFPDRAPEGGVLLSTFLGGIRKQEMTTLDDNELRNMVLNEISDSLSAGPAEPELVKIYRYQQAIPQYDHTSAARLEAIDRIEQAHPGLILAGNIRDGIGMADRVRQAATIAAQL